VTSPRVSGTEGYDSGEYVRRKSAAHSALLAGVGERRNALCFSALGLLPSRGHVHGVTGGMAQGPGISIVVKSAGLAISRYSMSCE